ncbi:hypothetical protein SVAN01_00283 [Stagonosporopsis vannaccii]|nr:hypothetical protein SVAN01_00283 [Stagonosporopsis vannaccii]
MGLSRVRAPEEASRVGKWSTVLGRTAACVVADAQEEKPELGPPQTPSLAAGLEACTARAPKFLSLLLMLSTLNCPHYSNGGLGNVALAEVLPKSRSGLVYSWDAVPTCIDMHARATGENHDTGIFRCSRWSRTIPVVQGSHQFVDASASS